VRHGLEFWGLLMNATGTVLVLIWPPHARQYYRDGTRDRSWAAEPLAHGVAKHWVQEVAYISVYSRTPPVMPGRSTRESLPAR
jgi:hypothetical protein